MSRVGIGKSGIDTCWSTLKSHGKYYGQHTGILRRFCVEFEGACIGYPKEEDLLKFLTFFTKYFHRLFA